MIDKKELRLKAKNIRKNLPVETISQKAVELLRMNSLYKNAQNVMIFYPMKYEIDLLELLNDNKNFYLPKVNELNIEVCPYIKGDELKKSGFGVNEPCTISVSADIIDLVVVPALMCDGDNYRLGYGGGYYDRFINKYGQNFKTISIIPKELFTKNLPHENTDAKIDEIIIIS